jgi:hypothetical protein
MALVAGTAAERQAFGVFVPIRSTILGLKMSKKCKDFESGICRTSIYGNFLVIAER